MRDLSLHLTDLCQNSIQAGAQLVEVSLALADEGKLTLVIRDDGHGMDADTLGRVHSPFTTHRTTRKVGMGIPLTENNAVATGGGLEVISSPGKGATLTAPFFPRHIDCPPLGDLAETMATLILANPEAMDFTLSLRSPKGEERLDTREIRQALGEDVPLNTPEVVQWMIQATQDMIQQIFGGELQ